jgi:hypothetical protein
MTLTPEQQAQMERDRDERNETDRKTRAVAAKLYAADQPLRKGERQR